MPTLSRAPGWDLDADLATVRARGLYRRLRIVDGPDDPQVIVDGRRAILLCSNNYLGLANHPDLVGAAREALSELGAGSGSSRLISGSLRIHEKLEAEIAAWKRAERALVFSSGYHANLGILQALVGRGDLVFSDELNHASLIDGCRLSRAEVRIYRHRDLEALEAALRSGGSARRRMIVTDSIFSMDGDRAPLAEICDLAERFGAAVMVDEAHATGVFGPSGAGLVEELGLRDRILVQMGTLGKALGSFGAYVTGSSSLIDILVNRARTFIFTTALPPPVVAAARAAIAIVRREPERRARLWKNASDLHAGLREAGYRLGSLESPILPVIVGEAEQTMALCEQLLERGVFAQGIRPPTVPAGTSRLRVTLMATHNPDHIGRALAAFREARREIP